MSADPNAIQLIMSLRRLGISDARVLAALERVPRERFVSEGFEAEAYLNEALPIACGQTISQPYVVALMTQALDVQDRHRVLEIGTGSGYQAAVLSYLARYVYTIERHRPLLRGAERRFRELGLANIVTRLGDGAKGWPELAPFDRIMITAAAPSVPEALLGQLKPGGVLVAPLGADTNSQYLTRIILNETGPESERLLPVRFVPLTGGLPEDA